ncbi:MAG TPA: alpha/beta hydrolase, partial [Chloroflexia bacterium]|nr:alpha/beta hydrolase [Chloroflexia bacterium]
MKGTQPRARYAALCVFVTLGTLLAATFPGPDPIAQARPTRVAPAAADEGLVDVGGYHLYYRCAGQGSPTVVLEAGLGTPSSTWDRVQPEVARFTRVCVYDRAGLGLSERGPAPRTSGQIVSELHTLLARAGIAGPYVVAGHSQGGLHMLLFAERYRSEVVGIVSVDGAPPDISSRYQAILTAAQFQQYQDLVGGNPEGMRYSDIVASEAEVRAAAPLPAVPLVILRHGQDTPQPAGWPVAALEQAWRDAQEALARNAPQGRVVLAAGSGHFIQRDQPALVISTLQAMVDQARSPGPPVAIPGTGSRTFPETGQTVTGRFLDYWTAHGGLVQQGFPISPPLRAVSELDGKAYTMQYLERAVFELHPENAPPYDILLSQLGSFQYHQKYPTGAPGQHASTAAGVQLFAATGKRVGGAFLAYWQAH